VVAVNGKAIQDARQLRGLRYDYSWRTGDEENIPMIVFRNGRYIEVKDTTAGMNVKPYPR